MKFFLSLALIMALLVSGCVSSEPATSNPEPTATVLAATTSAASAQTLPPTQSTAAVPEDADSRLPTPAGVVIYKGNLNGANLVPLATLTFAGGYTDTIYVTYRAKIETVPGTIRNEIVSVRDSTGKIRYNQIGPNSSTGDVTMTVSELPSGMTSEPEYPGFAFHISNDAKPGQYTFQIDLAISGRTYPLPVTITVL